MTKNRVLLMLVISSLSVSLFAGGFALSGVGSRATAMGGAFRGLSDDATAMFWNPAGLAFQDGLKVDLGGTFIMPSATWENPDAALTGLRPGETDSEKALKAFPNAFLTMAKHPKLKYGLGVFVPYGLGSTWDLYEINPAFNGADQFPENELSSSIAVIDVHPSVAYQILPILSAGAGLSLMSGTIDLAKFGASAAAPTYLLATTEISGQGMGFGGNIGLMFKPTVCMSMGLTAKLPASIKMEGDTKVMNYGLAAPPAGATLDTETTLNLPAEIGFGLSNTRIPNLTVNLDYAYTMWSSLDTIELDLTGAPDATLNFNWEDTSRVSLGAEYKMGCNNLRLGGYWDQSPIPEETQTPTLSDIGNKISANIGWGRMFGKLGVDANFQYVMFSEREVTTPTADNVIGTYNAQSLSGNIGLSWEF